MQNTKPAWTPLPTGYNPKISNTEATSDICSQYQSVIGSPLYIMLGTRPDIAHAVICMSQFCANPLQEHLSWALYIIQYLGSTKIFALCYDGANHDSFCHIPNFHLRILSSTKHDQAPSSITASPEYSDSA